MHAYIGEMLMFEEYNCHMTCHMQTGPQLTHLVYTFIHVHVQYVWEGDM